MKKLLLFLALAAVIGLAVGIYLYNKPVQSMHRLKADHQLSATDLYSAFDSDETAAMASYAGKILEVTGAIAAMNTSEEGDINIDLEGGGLLGGIRCRLDPAETGSAAALSPGQTITLRGQCDGKLMDVELSRCILVNSPQ